MPNFLIVPMRQGSKRYPLKNRKLFPLHLDRLQELKKSMTVVIVSDDRELINIAEYEGFTALTAPAFCCFDGSNSNYPILFAIDALKMNDQDSVTLYEVTHPLTQIEDVLACTQKTPCICLAETPHPAGKLLQIQESKILTSDGKSLAHYIMSSQAHQPSYIPTGVISNTVDAIKKTGSIYHPQAKALLVSQDLDIDHPPARS